MRAEDTRKMDRQRMTCSTAMISAFRFEGALPVATAYAWPAMKVYQPCRDASRSSFLPTSRARFSAEGSSRDSSSVPPVQQVELAEEDQRGRRRVRPGRGPRPRRARTRRPDAAAGAGRATP